mgnify:CR=1 FL=1
MENKVIRCQDCYNKFFFTVKQQQMYAEKGWQDPIRCPDCRARKKERWAAHEDIKALMGGYTMRKFSRRGSGFFRKLGR